ncbi:CLUMA_CG016265, isoform B [Clunio marinus]|uniref:CLUMA_CG016265, isoform B n=1 Tax=Clunio marinus TaxID=568069 RepID=A0A1J1IT00_9DIPT|nr:CLUMA_CG016265, isoform B [Clunio marinus]
MTVETTSFLSGTKITNNGSEKSAKLLKNNKNLIIILLAVILVLFCIGASVLQIWVCKRMNGMQQEIDQLKLQFDEFQKSDIFEDEMFDDLHDFSKKYNQNDVRDEMDLDDNLSISADKTKFDDVGDEDSSELSEESDDNYENIHSGYGDSYEDDELYDDLEDDMEEKPLDVHKENDDDDDNNIYKDMTRTRKTRSIVEITNQGVPVLEEPYTTHRNPTKSSLVAANALENQDEKNPRLKLTWHNNQRIFNGPRRQYHRGQYNRVHHNVRHHHNLEDSKRRFAFAAAPLQHTFANFGKTIMNHLYIAGEEINETDKVFHLTIDSYISVFVWKLLKAHDEVQIKLVAIHDNKSTVEINLKDVKYDNVVDDNVTSKLPMLQLGEHHKVIGLCSILRGMCNIMKTTRLKGDFAKQLLGFKENCLMSPSEVSLWTNFCEREMISCTERLRDISHDDGIEFPIEMIKFERDLTNPLRIHNVYKVARDMKQDRSIKSGSELDLEHKYCHGNEINLSDVILYSIYKLIFSSAVSVSDVNAIIPRTVQWFRNMEEEKLNESFEALTDGTTRFFKRRKFVGEIPEVNEDGKYFSLFKRQLTGYKHKNRKVFTDQTEIEIIFEKLKTLDVNITSIPGDANHDAVNDDYVHEILKCGQLPAHRFDNKKSQLKSIANEVLKVAQPNDVIVDFCSGTGHLGFLVAKLLPSCRVFILENKEESINRAKLKAKMLMLDNVTFFQCNLEYFNDDFTIGLSLHACGVATDLVLRKCWMKNAKFICSPCCYGKIQDLGNLPQSEIYRNVLSTRDLINIAHCSDQTHDAKNVKHINVEKAQQGYFCMDVIDTDRLLRANELGYSTTLTRLHPENCSLKNRLLIGKFNETSSPNVASAPIQSRSSRVMHVEDKSKAFRQVVRKDQLHKLQEARRAPEQWNSQNFNTRRRIMNPMRRNLELKNGKRMKITAAHFEGDSSSLALGRHHEYQGEEGNNKVKLNKNEYIHWQPADWINEHGMDRFFSMDPLGVLTVKDHGLFLIYAQVFYSDDHDVNGYVIEVNNRVRYQCTTMTHTTSRVTKINSCYTSGLIHLRHGDKIQLRDIGNHRSVLLEPSKSFFGLIKINLVAPSVESSEVETFTGVKK